MAAPAWRRLSASFWHWLRPGVASAIPSVIIDGKSIITTLVDGKSIATTEIDGQSIIMTLIDGKSII